nr:MAG TPA: hypothetical protein [Caudoviricetes sp.]
MTVNIMGVDFPFYFTVHARKAVDEKFGGLMEFGEKMKEASDEEAFEVICDLAAILIEAGVIRARGECELMGRKYEGPAAIDAEKIKGLLTPGEAMDLQPKIMDEIKRGHKTTIKLKPPKGKNAKATP